MLKLSIANEKHNISNVIWNAQGLKKTDIFVGIRETNFPSWIWIVATQKTDTPLGWPLWKNLKKKRASYWIHGNITLPDNTKLEFFLIHSLYCLKFWF